MTEKLRASFRGFVEGWNRYWFEADGRVQLRYFRIGFGTLLFACYVLRSLDFELFYGPTGIMPLSAVVEVAPMEFRFSIFRVWPSLTFLWIGNFVFLASLATFTLGVFPRVSVLIAWALHVSFVHRNLSIAYGVDMIACFFLFFFCFADFRKDSKYRPGDVQATMGSMSYRLFQIQVCIIYGYSGLKKLKGYTWWNGDAIWNSLADPQIARWDFSYLAHFPLPLAVAAYATLAWEIYFPALVWIRPARTPLLVVGVFLHIGIGVGMSLPFFATLMVLTYVFFLERATLEGASATLAVHIKKIRSKVPA